MPWRARISLAIFVLAVIGLVAIFISAREPRYQGRSLSEWLKISRSDGATREQRQESAEAIRHIGPRALPFLLRWSNGKPSTLRLDLRNLPHLPAFVNEWANKPPDSTRINQGRLGFVILGPEAAPAIPDLYRLVTNTGWGIEDHGWAVNALADIGPKALPALIAIATNRMAQYGTRAFGEIGRLETNAEHVLPALALLLNDADSNLAAAAAGTIGDIGIKPEIYVPVLAKSLRARNSQVRLAAAFSLRRFGSDARSAIPELEAAVENESDRMDQYSLSLILRDIRKLSEAPKP